MESPAERRPEEVVPSSPQGLYLTAIRFSEEAEPEEVLARLVTRLLRFAAHSGTRITLHVEPAGDACETGHWVCIHCEHGMVWAEMTPWPQRHNGVVPEGIDTVLDRAGWILLTTGPEDDSAFYFADSAEVEDLLDGSLPARRLVAIAPEDDLVEWAEQVCAAIHLVIEPVSSRWFVSAEARPGDDPRVWSTPHSDLDPARRWPVDIGALLEPNEWVRAVWPSGTEAAALCCEAGLHDLHEPPCEPAPSAIEGLGS